MLRTVIAIDGLAGSGKSTLARRLAAELGLPYVNTGLMYGRSPWAIRRGVIRHGRDRGRLIAHSTRLPPAGAPYRGFPPTQVHLAEVEARVVVPRTLLRRIRDASAVWARGP
jgi:hypothetical protein